MVSAAGINFIFPNSNAEVEKLVSIERKFQFIKRGRQCGWDNIGYPSNENNESCVKHALLQMETRKRSLENYTKQ